MEDWSGKTALVTGASRGIGRAIAERLALDGVAVAVHFGTGRAAADAVVAGIRSRGGTACAVGAEFGKSTDFESLWKGFLDFVGNEDPGGQLDILVNNAGINNRGSIEETTTESFDELFNVNFRTPFFLTRSALPHLRDGGRVINLSTGATRIARPDLIAYSSTKGALEVFTLALAQELGPRRITVNAVAPGIIETDMNKWLESDEGRHYATDISTLGRVGQPEDVAAIVCFLASQHADWVTGQVIDATGGSRL